MRNHAITPITKPTRTICTPALVFEPTMFTTVNTAISPTTSGFDGRSDTMPS